jgi:FKBP-type peptidyl-prolyl cis-trans isomerase
MARLAFFVPLVFLAGCMDEGPSGPLMFDEVRWDASLNIDASQFQELPTGVWVLDRQVGDGAVAGTGNVVRTHYRGWTPNGVRFDSSLDTPGRTPLVFALGGGDMIPGFDYGVRGMRKGGVRTVLIPPFLGYGSRPPGGSGIPANSWLVFEIHLVDVTS